MNKREHIGGEQRENGWYVEGTPQEIRAKPSSLTRFPLIHFDPSQVCLASQLVDTAEATFLTAHNRITLFVRPRNLPLYLASLAERFEASPTPYE